MSEKKNSPVNAAYKEKDLLINGFKPSNNACMQGTEFFASIFLNSPIGIFIVEDGKFRFVNPEFRRISGFSEEDLLGVNSLEIVLPEDRALVRDHARKMLKGEHSSPYHHRVVGKDGEIRWIVEAVAPIDFEGRKATLGFFLDTTEQELAKEAIYLSEDKFQKAFRSSPDWFVISTMECGMYLDVNEAFLRTTGYRREDVIGHTSIELNIWADPEKRNEMLRMLREKGVVRNMEAQFRTKSGSISHVLWSAEMIDYEGEKCIIAMAKDITGRIKAEEERLKHEKLQGVLETAGAACHELNQPLQYIYLLLSEAMEDSPESSSLAEMKKQLDRLRGITKKLELVTIYQTKDYIKGEKIIDIDKASKTG